MMVDVDRKTYEEILLDPVRHIVESHIIRSRKHVTSLTNAWDIVVAKRVITSKGTNYYADTTYENI